MEHVERAEIYHATLTSFDSGTYLAVVQLGRSPDTTLSGVPTSRAIAAGNMVAGKVVALVLFDPNNSADAMIVGVF
jgi:hypothetical protein